MKFTGKTSAENATSSTQQSKASASLKQAQRKHKPTTKHTIKPRLASKKNDKAPVPEKTPEPSLAETFRSLMRLTPSSVVAVIADHRRKNDEAHGMLAASFAPVTLEPEPCVSFNIKRPSRTYDQILQDGKFTVLAPDNAMFADTFARPGRKHKVVRETASKNGTLKRHGGVLWWAHCELLTDKCVDVGDHTIVVGRVVKAARAPDNLRDHVVVYADGQYRELGAQIHPNDDAFHIQGSLHWQGLREEHGGPLTHATRKAFKDPDLRAKEVRELMIKHTRKNSNVDLVTPSVRQELEEPPLQPLSPPISDATMARDLLQQSRRLARMNDLRTREKYLNFLSKHIDTLQGEIKEAHIKKNIPRPSLEANLLTHPVAIQYRRWLLVLFRKQRSRTARRLRTAISSGEQASVVEGTKNLRLLGGEGEEPAELRDEYSEMSLLDRPPAKYRRGMFKMRVSDGSSANPYLSPNVKHLNLNSAAGPSRKLDPKPTDSSCSRPIPAFKRLREPKASYNALRPYLHGRANERLFRYHGVSERPAALSEEHRPSLEQDKVSQDSVNFRAALPSSDQLSSIPSHRTRDPDTSTVQADRNPSAIGLGVADLEGAFSEWMSKTGPKDENDPGKGKPSFDSIEHGKKAARESHEIDEESLRSGAVDLDGDEGASDGKGGEKSGVSADEEGEERRRGKGGWIFE